MEAEVVATGLPYAWTNWWLDWEPPGAGDVEIMARATDTAGNVQPLEPSWNRLGYCNNGAVPHRIVVTPGAKEARS
jgi:hypothetical protein